MGDPFGAGGAGGSGGDGGGGAGAGGTGVMEPHVIVTSCRGDPAASFRWQLPGLPCAPLSSHSHALQPCVAAQEVQHPAGLVSLVHLNAAWVHDVSLYTWNSQGAGGTSPARSRATRLIVSNNASTDLEATVAPQGRCLGCIVVTATIAAENYKCANVHGIEVFVLVQFVARIGG